MSAADKAIRVSATAAVLGVAGIAAYVSYQHAYQVIAAHGETGPTARLEPATIDGLVYCSSMVILYATRHHLRVPGLARWLLALGIAATLVANLAHGWSHGPGRRRRCRLARRQPRRQLRTPPLAHPHRQREHICPRASPWPDARGSGRPGR